MSQYYEPQNQPAEEPLVDSKRPRWSVEDFLESVDIELNLKDETIEKLSNIHPRAIPPAIIDPRIIVVDGPIGAGKYLTDEGFRSIIIEEAVAARDFGSNDGITLEEYYKNPKELAFPFQEQVVHALGRQLLHCHFAEGYTCYHNPWPTFVSGDGCRWPRPTREIPGPHLQARTPAT